MAQPRFSKLVFLSSTGKDLVEYRKAIHDAIEELDGFHCVWMEGFTSQASSPEAYIKTRVQECDLLVGIVGLCYGASPIGSTKSYTEIEYDVAKQAKIPCLMFLCPDNFAVPGNLLHEDGRWDDQQRFRDMVSKDVIRSSFTSPTELARLMVAGIRNWEKRQDASTGDSRPSFSVQGVDCVVLCGGYAKRLWPLTIDISKVLLPVAGRPILAHCLDFVRRSRRIARIIISTNEKFGAQLTIFRDAYRAPEMSIPIEVIVEPSHAQSDKLGPVGALNYIVSKSEPRDLLVIGGDNLFGFELEDFLQFAEMTMRSANAFFHFESKEDVSQYGTAQLNSENHIEKFYEKQPHSEYRLVSTACYYLRRSDVQSISAYIKAEENPDSLGDLIKWLCNQHSEIAGFVFSSFWFDIGTREKLLEANWQFLSPSGNAQFQGDTVIREPVQIDPSATVKSSHLGPNVYIGPNASVIQSKVHDTLVMADAKILDGTVTNSIIGPGSMIEGTVQEGVFGPNTRISGAASASL